MLRALALAAALLASAARAEGTAGIVSAELLPGWRGADGAHVTALRLTLAPGWKTYWRAPGAAGIPPLFDWAGSRNVRAVHLHWPRPKLFMLGGLRTLGYARELVLPMQVVPERPGAPIHLAAAVDLGVCRDICVPATVMVRADLTAPGAPDAAIGAALAARPETAAEAGVRGHGCRVAATPEGLRVTAEVEVASLGPGEMVVIETADTALWVSETHSERRGGRVTAVADIVPLGGGPVALDRRGLTITLLSEGRAVELSGCPAR
ncbi:MAG: protein-disulfide reductase DsbD domain-containing protein [Gemmobacter sp.]